MSRFSALPLLFFAPAALADAVPAPPPCPWTQGGLYPVHANGGTVPTNAVFFIREFGSEPTYELLDGTTPVDFDVTRELIPAPSGGSLAAIRPRAELAPNRNYRLRAFGTELIGATTSSAADHVKPALPDIMTTPNTSPYQVCSSAGVLVQRKEWGDGSTFLVVERENSTDLMETEFYSYGFGGSVNGVFVPTNVNEEIRFRVVAIDRAGNRSDASDVVTAMAAGIPQPAGKAGPGPLAGDSSSGCTCVRGKAVSPSLLALALALALALRRRGVRRPASGVVRRPSGRTNARADL